jgi:phospholipid/cholesterol/gamma-HCH transport system permease protein
MSTNTVEKKISSAGLNLGPPDNDLLMVYLSGCWQTGLDLPGTDKVFARIESDPRIRSVSFDTSGLTGWDSNLLTFLISIKSLCIKKEVEYRDENLPNGAQRLLRLASAVPERQGARKIAQKESFFSRVGSQSIKSLYSMGEVLSFIGEAFISVIRFLTGKATFRWSDLFMFLRESGSQALPIVSLINMLVGLIPAC